MAYFLKELCLLEPNAEHIKISQHFHLKSQSESLHRNMGKFRISHVLNIIAVCYIVNKVSVELTGSFLHGGNNSFRNFTVSNPEDRNMNTVTLVLTNTRCISNIAHCIRSIPVEVNQRSWLVYSSTSPCRVTQLRLLSCL